jgi:hypothetical protein
MRFPRIGQFWYSSYDPFFLRSPASQLLKGGLNIGQYREEEDIDKKERIRLWKGYVPSD